MFQTFVPFSFVDLNIVVSIPSHMTPSFTHWHFFSSLRCHCWHLPFLSLSCLPYLFLSFSHYLVIPEWIFFKNLHLVARFFLAFCSFPALYLSFALFQMCHHTSSNWEIQSHASCLQLMLKTSLMEPKSFIARSALERILCFVLMGKVH